MDSQTVQERLVSPSLLGSFRLRVQLVPGHICNYACPFCHRDGDWMNDNSMKLHPSLVLKVYEAAKQFGCAGVSLTGGEPLLHPLLNDFLAELEGVSVSITTNGARLTPRMLGKLENKGVERLIVSVPSVDDDRYFLLTGQRALAPSQILEYVSHAVQAGIRVTINMPLCRGINDTPMELERMMDACFRIGVSELHFLEIVRHPNNPVTESLHFSALTVNNLFQGLEYIGPRLFGHSYKYLDRFPVNLLMCGSCSMICRSCPSAASLLLTSRGTLRPCMWYELKEIVVDEENAVLAIEEAFGFLRNNTISSPVTFYPIL